MSLPTRALDEMDLDIIRAYNIRIQCILKEIERHRDAIRQDKKDIAHRYCPWEEGDILECYDDYLQEERVLYRAELVSIDMWEFEPYYSMKVKILERKEGWALGAVGSTKEITPWNTQGLKWRKSKEDE